jgi:hypothetical protein
MCVCARFDSHFARAKQAPSLSCLGAAHAPDVRGCRVLFIDLFPSPQKREYSKKQRSDAENQTSWWAPLSRRTTRKRVPGGKHARTTDRGGRGRSPPPYAHPPTLCARHRRELHLHPHPTRRPSLWKGCSPTTSGRGRLAQPQLPGHRLLGHPAVCCACRWSVPAVAIQIVVVVAALDALDAPPAKTALAFAAGWSGGAAACILRYIHQRLSCCKCIDQTCHT